MEIKKVVLQLEIHDDRDKKKALKIVSSVPGVESLSIDMKDQKLTVIGDVDPVCLTKKLRKYCHTKIFTVGPAKEPEKKKEEPKKKEEAKKPDGVHQIVMPYNPYVSHAYCHNPGYYARVEEDPYGCVIC